MSAAATNPDRRTVLGGSLALASAVVASAAPAGFAATGAGHHPDAVLLQLVGSFFAAEAERVRIYAASDDAFERYVAPPVPTALLCQSGDGPEMRSFTRLHDSVVIDGGKRYFYAREADVPTLRSRVEAWRQAGYDSPYARRGAEIIAALDDHTSAVKRAEDEAGITLFHSQADAVEARKDELLRRIAITPATTPDGLQAKACAAIEDTGADPVTWLAETHIPELLASSKAIDIYTPLGLAAVFSLVVDAARLGLPAPAGNAEAIGAAA